LLGQVSLRYLTFNQTRSETPLVQKLLDTFGVNHGVKRLWPIPWSVALGCPNQMHRHHPHTVGHYACTRFGVIPPAAQVVGSVAEGKMVLARSVHRRISCWRWGGEGESKGEKVDS
jgi:hypothetical protein